MGGWVKEKALRRRWRRRMDGRTDCGFGSFGGQRGRRRAGVRWRAGGRMVGWLGGVGGGGGGIGQIDIDLPRGMSERRTTAAAGMSQVGERERW